MADHNTLAHVFVSPVADAPDPTHQIVHPSDWNKEHRFVGGSDGYYLMKNSAYSDGVTFDNIWVRLGGNGIDVTRPPYNVPVSNPATSTYIDAVPALTNMFNALGANGGTLYFPPGTYWTNQANLISLTDANQNLSLIGGGGDQSVLRCDQSGGNVVSVNASAGTALNLRFVGLTFDGNSASDIGLYLIRTQRTLVENCRFRNSRFNAIRTQTASGFDLTIRRCYFSSGSVRAGNAAISLTNTAYTLLEHNAFIASSFDTALYLNGASQTLVSNCYFGPANWATNTIALYNDYTELANYYETSAGYVAYVWGWNADAPLSIFAPLTSTAIDLRPKLAAAGRDQRLLTFLGNPGAPSAPTSSQIPALQMTGGLSTQVTGVSGTLNRQVSATGVPNPAGTATANAFTYTIPANTLARDGQAIQATFLAHAGAIQSLLWGFYIGSVAGLTIANTATAVPAGQHYATLTLQRAAATTCTASITYTFGAATATTYVARPAPFTVNNLSTNVLSLAAIFASPSAGNAGDIVGDSLEVRFLG